MLVIAPRVAVDSEVHSGEPVMEGTRVPVSIVVGAVAAGDSIEEVAQEYGIAAQDVRAALSYAAKLLEGETVRAPPLTNESRMFGLPKMNSRSR